jgi:zinc protease
MRKIPLHLLIIIGLILQSACSHHQSGIRMDDKTSTLSGAFQVRKVKFPNGLKLLILKDDSSPTFAYQTWFDVGSRNEVIGKTGLAHLFEHMMFKGTSKYPDGKFDSILEQAGVEGENAFTSNDHTVYVQELPNNRLDLIIELESDRMTNLIVDDQSFKTEREVVQNERRLRKENSPEGTLYQTLFETIFSDSPYHWPVIGYEEDLTAMNAQDARDFYQRYYSPDRATIVVVGDVNESEVIRKVEKAYGSIPAKNTPDQPFKRDADQTAQKRKKVPLNIQNEKLWMGFRIPEAAHEDTPVFEVIQSLLSDGMNSRLNRALVNSGISTSASTGSFSMKDPGIFIFMTDLQKGKSAKLAESIILREIEQLKNKPVPAEELSRAKNVLRFGFYQQMVNTKGKAHFLGESETKFGNYEHGLRLREEIMKVTPDQIMKAAQQYFKTTNMTVLTGVPKK